MSENHPEDCLACLLGKERRVDCCQYFVVVAGGVLKLVKSGGLTPKTHIVIKLNAFDINEGLTSKQWQSAAKIIRKFRKDGIL